MALLVCKACKKAFISDPQEKGICPDCDARLRELYPSVRNFLRNNDGVYTVQDVSRIMGIALEDVIVLASMNLVESKMNRKAADDGKSGKRHYVRKKTKSARRQT